MGARVLSACWLVVAATLVIGEVSGAPPRRRTYDFMGVIERVDTAARTLVVRIGSKKNADRETIRYDADTELVRARKPVDASAIRSQMRVWVYLREDAQGKPTGIARRLTLADPYPDITGTVTAVDVKAGTVQITRQYPGGKSGDRPQILTVRVSRDTVITMEKRSIKLSDIPLGRRCQITSARGADDKTTSVAAKITVWKAMSPQSGKAGKHAPVGEESEPDSD